MDSPGRGDDEPSSAQSADDRGADGESDERSADDRFDEPPVENEPRRREPEGDGTQQGASSSDPPRDRPGSHGEEPDTGRPTRDDEAPPPEAEDRPSAGASDRNRPTAREPRRDDRNEWVTFGYDVVSSILAVVIVGGLLFTVSGVWPPMVAVESPSMTPNMQTGDLVFVMEEQRFPGAQARNGVVTAQTGTDLDYRKFGRAGDVIVYEPDGNGKRTPIIHRAMFWVEEGENWYEKADRQSVGRYSECGETTEAALPNCPAPHSGFITKGDANGKYDQVQGTTGLSAPVRPAWVVGTAELRVPLLGCIRLRSEGCWSLSTSSSMPKMSERSAGALEGSPLADTGRSSPWMAKPASPSDATSLESGPHAIIQGT